jgi:hypothetical protein
MKTFAQKFQMTLTRFPTGRVTLQCLFFGLQRSSAMNFGENRVNLLNASDNFVILVVPIVLVRHGVCLEACHQWTQKLRLSMDSRRFQ